MIDTEKILAFATITIALLSLLVFRIVKLRISPHVEVIVEGAQVYGGSEACVDISERGGYKMIEIKRGYLCFFPGQTYISNSVEVVR